MGPAKAGPVFVWRGGGVPEGALGDALIERCGARTSGAAAVAHRERRTHIECSETGPAEAGPVSRLSM